MSLGIDIALLVTLVVFDFSLLGYLNERDQKDYEHEFLLLYQTTFLAQDPNRARGNAVVPLRFQQRHFNNLLSLCKQYRYKFLPRYYFNKRSVEKYGPRVQVQYISFRRIRSSMRPRHPIRIEVIRCSNKYAIISANDGDRGYLLKKGEHFMDGVKFYILTKFYYKERPAEEVQPVHHDPTPNQD